MGLKRPERTAWTPEHGLGDAETLLGDQAISRRSECEGLDRDQADLVSPLGGKLPVMTGVHEHLGADTAGLAKVRPAQSIPMMASRYRSWMSSGWELSVTGALVSRQGCEPS
jgi:hypothetical protein